MILEMLEHHLLAHPLGVKLFGYALSSDVIPLAIVSLLLCVLLPLIIHYKKPALVFTAVEAMAVFIRDGIVLPNMGEKGRKFTPYFCTLFLFILLANICGMVPGGRSATGNISVTAGLALTTFLLINFTGIYMHGVGGYLKTFVPHGTPAWLVPLIFPLEVLGLLTKTIALCVRLFANMIAGHIILIVLIGMIFIFGATNMAVGLGVSVPVVLMSLFINVLEVLVVFIQAYVFTMLTAIFTGAVIDPH